MQDSVMGEEKTLAFDLRIFYAGILGKKMVKVEMAQDETNYVKWFRQLRLMFPVVLARVDKNRQRTMEEYNVLIKECVDTFNKYDRVYLKRDFGAEGIEKVENKLLKLQHFIYRVMDKNKLFGENLNLQGL